MLSYYNENGPSPDTFRYHNGKAKSKYRRGLEMATIAESRHDKASGLISAFSYF